jgi:N-acetylmuramoyl-L-alanine amidase
MLRRIAAFALLATLSWTPAASAAPRPVVERPLTIVLDPGHGGGNHGCASAHEGVEEKQVTLWIAQELQARLAERLPHATVVLTRGGDRSMTLAERVAIANEREADVFVSIHANASETKTQHGFETYVLDARASSLEAARTAWRENVGPKATRPAASDAAAMLKQLELQAHRQRAARLAQAIQRGQAQRFPVRLDRGVKQAPFDVLMGANMPAVLFEAGFLDHAEEANLLTDPEARALVVDGLADALVEFYRAQGRDA